ncbi:Hypothetical predicted protein [Paramuricea clavata]|uniref:Uncharacterized protein n=1 Tax=Paramuricea clavata TaxID=317549 RepID=A0A7D9HCZ8_PARCT|nr:Hypothetical predicted protein [Paramuricea clavata]
MPKEKGKSRSGPTRGSTYGRPQHGIEQMPAPDVGESLTLVPSTAAVNYADLSVEVFSISSWYNEILRFLGNSDHPSLAPICLPWRVTKVSQSEFPSQISESMLKLTT